MAASPTVVSPEECIELVRTLGAVQRTLAMRMSPELQARHGLDFKQFVFLKRIQTGTVYPGDLARSGFGLASRITRHLDKLESAGLIRRSLDADDSRRIRLGLTPKADALLTAVDADLAAFLGPALAPLSPELRQAMRAGLQEVLANLA